MKAIRHNAYDSDHMTMDAFGFTAGLPIRSHPFEAGDSVFRSGGRVTRMFFVSEGLVHLLRPLESGTSAIMQVARRGAWLAEASLFSSRYHCDARSAGESVLLSVSKAELITRLASNADQAMGLARWMALHLRELRQLHEIVRVRSAKARVLRWLEWKSEASGDHLTLERTWSEVADELALTREALYRVLADLKRMGKIRVDGRSVTLIRRR